MFIISHYHFARFFRSLRLPSLGVFNVGITKLWKRTKAGSRRVDERREKKFKFISSISLSKHLGNHFEALAGGCLRSASLCSVRLLLRPNKHGSSLRKNLLWDRTFSHPRFTHSPSLSAIYIYDFLARRKFYVFPILHEYIKARMRDASRERGSSIDVTQKEHKKVLRGKTTNFHHTSIESATLCRKMRT